MAKRKKSSGGGSGSGVGMILTLVFFVLATFIAGTIAYFAHQEIDTHKNAAAKAKEEQKAAEARFGEERVRKVMLRIAMGVDDPSDRILLVEEVDRLRPQIKDEYDRMKVGLDEKIPEVTDEKDRRKKSAFYWPLLTMTNQEIQDLNKDLATGLQRDPAAVAADPATGPLRTVPAMVRIYEAIAKAAETKQHDAEARAANAEKLLTANTVDKGKIEMNFQDALARIQKEQMDKYGKLDIDFQNLVRKHANDGKTATDRIRDLGVADNTKADVIAALNAKLQQTAEALEKERNQAAASNRGAVGVDYLLLEEKKGEIVRKEEGGYVIINIGSAKKLRPQVTFLVISSDVSWLALMEKEESLRKNTYRNDRQTFEENPYVKAGIEVVEILGPELARAKILFENEPIRNPVQARDQIFNLSWQPAEEIRIAFAGIIDLDGDGLDNNEDFLRMLERQGVVVDEYLKMKPLEFVKRDGKGMSLRTKYLVIAPDPRLESLPTDRDTPQTLQIKAAMAQMSDIKNRARELGVQVIEARKFLAMIGYKLPRNPQPPQYGASAYFDFGGGGQPKPEMKKEGN